MRDRLRWVALLCVALLALTACAGGEQAADEASEPAAGGSEEGTATAGDEGGGEGGEVALRWRTRPDNQAEIDVYSQVSTTVDEALDNVTLEYEPGGSETSQYQDVLRTELASGTAPDVFWLPGTDIADFATRGLILDLRELAEASDSYAGDDAYYPGPMEFLTYDPESGESGGALWGLPRDVSTFALYLNLDLIEQAGAPDPRELAENGEWNWDTFRQVAEAVNGVSDQTRGFAVNNWWANWGLFVNAAGGSLFNEDRTACALDSEEAQEGLSFLQGLYEDGLVVPYGEDGEPPWLAGQVGMFLNGRWATPGARSGADFQWDVVTPPEGPGGIGNWLFWGAYVVNANTEHPEEAFELITQLTSPEVQTQIAELGTNIPSRVDDPSIQEQFLTYTPPDNNQAYLDSLEADPVAEGPLWEGNWTEYDAAASPLIQQVLAGEQSVEDFAAEVCGVLDPTFQATR